MHGCKEAPAAQSDCVAVIALSVPKLEYRHADVWWCIHVLRASAVLRQCARHAACQVSLLRRFEIRMNECACTRHPAESADGVVQLLSCLMVCRRHR